MCNSGETQMVQTPPAARSTHRRRWNTRGTPIGLASDNAAELVDGTEVIELAVTLVTEAATDKQPVRTGID